MRTISQLDRRGVLAGEKGASVDLGKVDRKDVVDQISEDGFQYTRVEK